MPGLASAKPFALKFFFSNQYVYAHIQRRADGVVRCATRRAQHARPRFVRRGADTRPPRPQIVAAASTIEKALRETLPSRTDVSAATKIGVPERQPCSHVTCRPLPDAAFALRRAPCRAQQARGGLGGCVPAAFVSQAVTQPAAYSTAACTLVTRLFASQPTGVLFEKPRGKLFHGKMAALVHSVRAGGIKV